jgi:hypothetical protein
MQQDSVAQTALRWEPEALSLGIKRPGRKTDHSLTCNTDDENEWSYTYIPTGDFNLLKPTGYVMYQKV